MDKTFTFPCKTNAIVISQYLWHIYRNIFHVNERIDHSKYVYSILETVKHFQKHEVIF